MSQIAKAAAERIWAEHQSRRDFQSVSDQLAGFDANIAYEAQSRLVELMTPAAGRPIGYKIGLTSERMQEMCGIDQPVAGRVLARRLFQSPCRVNLNDYVRLGVESELCVIFKHDVPRRSVPYSIAELQGLVGTICAAFELVDDRNADYSALDALSLIADNSWNAGVVLAEGSDLIDMCNRRGVLHVNGELVDSARSSDALGNPMAVVQWLADHLHAQKEQLRAGDLVMTGSIIPTRFARRGEHYHFELAGLPPAELWVD